MAGDVDAARIATEACGVLVDMGDGAAHLLRHRHQVAADVIDVVEINDDAVGACVHEQLSQERELARAAAAPGAAVDIDVDRRVVLLATIDVDPSISLAPYCNR